MAISRSIITDSSTDMNNYQIDICAMPPYML